MTCCVTWVANWLSGAQGYIKLTSAYSRLEKLWVRFDQTLFFLCIWILLFFASWGTVRIILGPRLYFPFSCLHFTPKTISHSAHLSGKAVPWGLRHQEQGPGLLMEPAVQAGGQLQPAWSPHHQAYLCWDTGTTNPQDQDCGPDKWSMARHRSRQ